jgi:hypothetical protein
MLIVYKINLNIVVFSVEGRLGYRGELDDWEYDGGQPLSFLERLPALFSDFGSDSTRKNSGKAERGASSLQCSSQCAGPTVFLSLRPLVSCHRDCSRERKPYL